MLEKNVLSRNRIFVRVLGDVALILKKNQYDNSSNGLKSSHVRVTRFELSK